MMDLSSVKISTRRPSTMQLFQKVRKRAFLSLGFRFSVRAFVSSCSQCLRMRNGEIKLSVSGADVHGAPSINFIFISSFGICTGMSYKVPLTPNDAENSSQFLFCIISQFISHPSYTLTPSSAFKIDGNREIKL